ncbi:MAG: amidohydrolase family protein [Longimicrobiales bacterium]
MRVSLLLSLALLAPLGAGAQTQTITVPDYTPKSSLKVPEHTLTRAKFPFIDVHSHHNNMSPERLQQIAAEMDQLNMGLSVNLSGRQGVALKTMVDNVKGAAAGRFVVFANLSLICGGRAADASGCVDSPGWTERAVAQLEEDVKNGARGLKIFKNLGMDVKDSKGERVATNDARLDPVWAKAGQLGIPVLIHTADPHQFWLPFDQFNERWYELWETRRIRDPELYPPWEQLMGEQWDIIKRHRGTNFISAHLSWLGGDLARLGKLMDERPNMYTELGAVLAELGRQPRFAKQFVIKYQDRILMGKDTYTPAEFYTYFRVLETDDEYFDYYRRRHAFWKMYGLGLPDEVLKKVYYKNALKLIPGIDKTRFPN